MGVKPSPAGRIVVRRSPHPIPIESCMSLDQPQSVEEAIESLVEGNRRFVRMRLLASSDGPVNLAAQDSFLSEQLAPTGQVESQSPFCAILACADARVPAEIVFDTGPNRLFVVRVAGNVPGDECLGSIEYAARELAESMKCVAVVGHVGCGGVGAAVKGYLNPKGYSDIATSRSLRAVINHVMVAVRSAALSMEQVWGDDVADDPGYTAALSELAVYLNAGITAFQLRNELRPEDPPVYFAVYDLASSKVGFPVAPNGFESALRPAPTNPDDLVALGLEIARSNPVRHHLKSRRFSGGKS